MRLYRALQVFSRYTYRYSARSHSYFTLKKVGIDIPKSIVSDAEPLKSFKYVRSNSTNVGLQDLFEVEALQFEADILDGQDMAKNTLYKNSNDTLINKFNNSASIQELFNVFKENFNKLQHEHLLQILFVLRDFQQILYSVHSETKQSFYEKLRSHPDFRLLLETIGEKQEEFDKNTICYAAQMLTKLGLSIGDPLLESLCFRIRSNLVENFNLSQATKFIATMFSEYSVRPYFFCQDIVPMIFKRIDSCTINELEELTLCLNKMNMLLPDEYLEKYMEKVKKLISNGELSSMTHKLLIKVILLLNYPQWREKTTTLMSECLLLMKGSLIDLNPRELMCLYEVFFKIQEPGDILNELQRNALKHLKSLEDDACDQTDIQLFLIAALVYFTQPINRAHNQRLIRKYLNSCKTYEEFFLVLRVLSYIKTSDKNLCDKYWDNLVKMIESNESSDNLLQLCQNYISFNTDIDNYRNRKVEQLILSLIQKHLNNSIVGCIPAHLCTIFCFLALYGSDRAFFTQIFDRLRENCSQLGSLNALNLAQILRITDTFGSESLTHTQRKVLNQITEDIIEKEITATGRNSKDYICLLKSCVLQEVKSPLLDRFLEEYAEKTVPSSKLIENVSYCFLMRNLLVPKILDKLVDYVVDNKDNVLGFNAERVIYLCYVLGYQPKNSDKFFDVVIDIIIRDQKRLSGLAFLQTALALCYFQKLPLFYVKSIFNVEFLEKLDQEVDNCYSKDKYPRRIRNRIMQLNRAVCLQYPEANVPWFHEKYLEVVKKKTFESIANPSSFFLNIKEYLLKIIERPEYILENVITPYGYPIDFVINLDGENNLVEPKSNNIKNKLAVLLLRKSAFTKVFVQLKGKYRLKIKHLELLGYQVVLVNINDWRSCSYAEEKLEYLSNLLWPFTAKRELNYVDR